MKELKNLDIIDSFNVNDDYKSILQRYYTPMYCTKIDEKDVDHQCVLFHSNRICLITIAPSHPIVAEKKQVVEIDFVAGNVDRLKNKVSGKGKRGGQKLEEKSILCRVKCEDGFSYDIYSCVPGKLIEINKNLITNPNLLVTHYNTYGYVGIVLIDLKKLDSVKERLVPCIDCNK